MSALAMSPVGRKIGFATFGLVVSMTAGTAIWHLGWSRYDFTELAHQARQEALDRLSQHAKSMGANAILSVMFDSTEMAASMEEIIAFGTAVVVSQASGDQQLVKLS